MEKQDEIIFSITTYNRGKIAVSSITDLIASIPKSSILIADDCSTEIELCRYFHLIENPTLFSYKFKGTCISHDIEIVRNSLNLGVDINNANRLSELFGGCFDKAGNIWKKFIYLTDSDVQYSSHFWEQLKNLAATMNADSSVLAGTLFNVEPNGCHNQLGTYSENSNYVYKRSFGGISMLIRYEDFEDAMVSYSSSGYDGNEGWDWAVCRHAEKVGRKLISSKDSYVQHIGMIGANSTSNNYDFAKNFIL